MSLLCSAPSMTSIVLRVRDETPDGLQCCMSLSTFFYLPLSHSAQAHSLSTCPHIPASGLLLFPPPRMLVHQVLTFSSHPDSDAPFSGTFSTSYSPALLYFSSWLIAFSLPMYFTNYSLFSPQGCLLHEVRGFGMAGSQLYPKCLEQVSITQQVLKKWHKAGLHMKFWSSPRFYPEAPSSRKAPWNFQWVTPFPVKVC